MFSTGIKRVLEGEIKPAASKAEEGKLHIKYTTVPLTPETNYVVLETDYKNFAVLWNCNGIGPFHTQNAWIMTRARIPPGDVLQQVIYINFFFFIIEDFIIVTIINFFLRLTEYWINIKYQKLSL